MCIIRLYKFIYVTNKYRELGLSRPIQLTIFDFAKDVVCYSKPSDLKKLLMIGRLKLLTISHTRYKPVFFGSVSACKPYDFPPTEKQSRRAGPQTLWRDLRHTSEPPADFHKAIIRRFTIFHPRRLYTCIRTEYAFLCSRCEFSIEIVRRNRGRLIKKRASNEFHETLLRTLVFRVFPYRSQTSDIKPFTPKPSRTPGAKKITDFPEWNRPRFTFPRYPTDYALRVWRITLLAPQYHCPFRILRSKGFPYRRIGVRYWDS